MPSFDFSYEYDGAGNRSKKINNLTSEVTTYVYDSANQLISMEGPDGITTFDWDAAGNMIAKHAPEGTTTYTWDYRNRLTQVAPPVGDPINFAYNAMGQRIQKNGTRFIYDGVQMLQETDLNNQTLRSNTFTNEGYGDLVSENDGTDSSFPTFNGQWSTDALVDNTATVTDRLGYSAFGVEDSHTGSSRTPFRFVGKQSYYNDAETGLYLLGAGGNPNGAGRYYDPELGRFISRDPIGLAGGDVNLYRYAGNNPINQVDPSGLSPSKSCTKGEGGIKSPSATYTRGRHTGCTIIFVHGDDVNVGDPKSSLSQAARRLLIEGVGQNHLIAEVRSDDKGEAAAKDLIRKKIDDIKGGQIHTKSVCIILVGYSSGGNYSVDLADFANAEIKNENVTNGAGLIPEIHLYLIDAVNKKKLGNPHEQPPTGPLVTNNNYYQQVQTTSKFHGTLIQGMNNIAVTADDMQIYFRAKGEDMPSNELFKWHWSIDDTALFGKQRAYDDIVRKAETPR